MFQPALIGVDWGSSAFRAALISETGDILDRKASDEGLLAIVGRAFEPVLNKHLAGWDQELPVLITGMAGSRQGWVEAPYLPCPVKLSDIAQNLTRLRTSQNRLIHFVPGLSYQPEGRAPDVMRGEETKILSLGQDGLVVLPGTHCKWALVEQDTVVTFQTFMTGDLFAALKHHTILSLFMKDSVEDEAAFARGVAVGRSDEGRGLIGKLFSARSYGLFGTIPEASLESYLSGLLIGTEVAEGMAQLSNLEHKQMSLSLVGKPDLTQLYVKAFDQCGMRAKVYEDDPAIKGLWRIAKAAFFLKSS